MLLPFWEATFAEMGLSPKRILIIRDPAEVAASQASRAAANPSFHRFAPGAASMHALWLRIMLTILGALPEGSETLLLKHADLFDKPLDSLGAVAQFLGIPVSSDRLITIASEYILPELRRAQRSDGMPDTGIAQVSGRMFEALSQLSPPTTMTGLKAHELTIVDPQLSLFNVLTVPVMETFSSATVAADADRMRTALLRRAVNLFADIAIRDASAGNSEETLHKLSEMAAGGTDDPEIFIFRQGQLCLRLGEYERALQLYSELAKQRPRFAPARVGQMQAYIKLGQPEKANKIREAADALFPKHPAFKVLPASKK
jgi:tetratricopeptide (TPR) repeat protein